MSNRLAITLLIYGLAQGALFGAGVTAVIIADLTAVQSGWAIAGVVAASLLIAAPIAWKIAPLMRAGHQQRLARKNSLGAPFPT
ncbi:MAG: hypothetical protein WA989_07820 [Henriciella sp.]|uniref:hypothetical protein n=1 Tax=Henriciella sp. TaxID=1968823 RepID=UPI003C788D84